MTSLFMTLFFACGDKEEEQDTAVEEVVDETSEDTEVEDTAESSDPVEEEDTATETAE